MTSTDDTSLEDALNAAFDESMASVAPPTAEPTDEPAGDVTRDEKGRFAAKADGDADANPAPEPALEPAPETAPVDVAEPPPPAWSGSVKAKWADLPADVRSEITKREADIHQMFTRHDGDLNLGRQMKDVVTPYMPIINAAGLTPSSAVQQLLNTDYQLRTGSPEQKIALARQLMADYGIDASQVTAQPEYVDPTVQSLKNEIAQLRQQFDPQAMTQRLQEQQQRDTVQREVDAFAADPANVHFPQVRSLMSALMGSGHAKTLQEAYVMACQADPTVRSTLLAKQKADEEAKRKSEIAAKQKAASSIAGSPGLTAPHSTANTPKSLEEALSEAFDASLGQSTI